MPRINRIRIINFSYNNDMRHIQDEMFNFHGGENALLSLANGGGKSVLVQLIFQPIVPETKIQGRRINAFFRKRRLPAYVLIEWKLDGAGGYLLTGIGMASAEVSGVEDEKNRVKYFTFTSKYTGADAFDLAHIELVKKNGNILEIKPFKEAREILADLAKKDPYRYGCFYDDDGERYRKHLAEFGIAQDEWKNIIAKINDSEGGLDEIFQKYKSSSQLLNEWIIKTVEKVIYKDRSQAHRLEEMLQGIVQEVIENERFILEKQVLDEFMISYGEQVGALVDLLNGLEEQKRLASKLTAIQHYLQAESGRLQDDQEKNKLELANQEREQQRIELEERSHDYWLRHERFIQAQQEFAEAVNNYEENDEKLQKVKFSAKILQAAGLRDDIGLKKAELSGIHEKLKASRSEYDTDQRRRDLEYSLKQLAQETLQTLELALSRLKGEKAELGRSMGKLKEDVQNLDRKLRSYEKETGSLEAQKKQYEVKERDVLEKLKLNLSRNLLGDLVQSEIVKSRSTLQTTLEDFQKQEALLSSQKAEKTQRQLKVAGEVRQLQENKVTENNGLKDLNREIAEYELQEQEVLSILQKFGFNAEVRFDREHLHSLFNQRIKNLDQKLEEFIRIRDDSLESLTSLKDRRLHIPGEVISMLASKDIPYDTGETYLLNLAPELRRKLLQENPVLPYALILSKENIEALAQELQRLTLRRVLPLIAYEDLGNKILSITERMVQAGEGLALVCLYEGRLFDKEGIVELEEELRRRHKEALEHYEHYSEERNDAVTQQAICGRFVYKADYRYLLGKKKTAAEKQLAEIDKKIGLLESESENLIDGLKKLERSLQETVAARQKAETDQVSFEEWLKQEENYQACRRKLAEINEALRTADAQKSEQASKLDKLQDDLQSVESEINHRSREAREVQKKVILYQEAKEAEIVQGTLEELESRLQALKATYTGEIELLEAQSKSLKLECAKKEKELDKLGLKEEDYQDVPYDEVIADNTSAEISVLEERVKSLQKLRSEAGEKRSSAETASTIAYDEVKKLGAESPLGPEEIKGDFQGRRRRLSAEVSRLNQVLKQISREISGNDKLMDQISPILKGTAMEPEKDFYPELDVQAQTESLIKIFRELENSNRSRSDSLRNKYAELKAEYRDRNPNISSIFKGLDLLWDKTNMAYEEYFYLFERMSQHREKLKELITLHENQLSNLERNKRDMIQQCLLQGMRFYEEIQWITEHSKVRLQGKNRPVHMLKVDLSLDSNDAAELRMKKYVEECILRVREEARQEKSEAEVKKAIAKLMYSRELLNVYLGYSNIPIEVYKIDLNMKNSGLKVWEDAILENSGGEKFVVYFSVLSALMSYTRARTLEAVGADEEKDSSVLIMDNPFGPISSEHLLSPLFEIAKKHRTQLICLSDLKQNSIMNCFNLIYMLKVRTSAVGNNEYLKFEEVIRDESALQNDEKLEKAVFRVSEHKQINLFE